MQEVEEDWYSWPGFVCMCVGEDSYVAMQQRAVMSVCHSFRKQPQVKCSLIFYPFLFDRRWGHKNSLVLMARVLKRQPQQGRGFDRRETEQHLKMLPCWIVKLVSLSFDTDSITKKCRGWASTSVSAGGQEELWLHFVVAECFHQKVF